jgi:microsomal epoxide hydrolase
VNSKTLIKAHLKTAVFIINKKLWSIPIVLGMLWAITAAMGKEPGPWKDRFQEVGDIKIHYLEAGSGESSLILLADWTLPAEIWREQIVYFASRGFKVLALDPRSYGLSTKSDSGNTYQQQAADLHAFLEALKLEHSYMIGWGAGAITLLEYVSSPESSKPEKMVFIDCIPSYLRSDDYPGAITTPQQARKRLLNLQDDRTKATEQFVRSLFKTSQPEYVIKSMTSGILKTPMGAAASLYFDLYTGDRRPALLHVSVPSLIITTAENRAVGEYMRSKISRSELQVIDNAGTAMFFEKPQEFNQRVESFFGAH